MALFCWIFTIIALVGAYFNSLGDKKGFYFWIASNTAFALVNFEIGQYAQSFLFLVYLAISINGIAKWTKIKSPKN